MTQEEKAKAYDDLLVKLQKAKVDNNVCDERYCCVIDDIVPELIESEDERIRKALIEFVQGMYMGCCTEEAGKERDMFLTWLEKQGNANKEYWRGYREGKQEILDKYAELEKQGEQNLANSAKTCKDAWSEEDEVALCDALWCCKQAASIAKDENDMGNVWYAENWLKSLRPQSTWKPSDEQMGVIAQSVAVLKVSGYGELGDRLGDISEQLNKLR